MVEIQPFLGNYELWNKLQIKTFLRTLWHGIQTQGKGKMAKDGRITNQKILIKVLYCVCVCLCECRIVSIVCMYIGIMSNKGLLFLYQINTSDANRPLLRQGRVRDRYGKARLMGKGRGVRR